MSRAHSPKSFAQMIDEISGRVRVVNVLAMNIRIGTSARYSAQVMMMMGLQSLVYDPQPQRFGRTGWLSSVLLICKQ